MRAALLLFPYGGVEVETLESVMSELAASPEVEWTYDRVGNDARERRQTARDSLSPPGCRRSARPWRR